MLFEKILPVSKGAAPTYIEDVFSTYLYTGTSAAQTITNGIDLAGKGGMVWIKSRSAATNNIVVDTVRGTGKVLTTNTQAPESNELFSVTAFNSNGFSISSYAPINTNNSTYVSWTFREQKKFFDVVTYTGNGSFSNRTINHNLGSTPGMIIVMSRNGSYKYTYHSSLGATKVVLLDDTSQAYDDSNVWGNASPTDTNFTIQSTINTNLVGYVAYLFAHDTSTDGLIQCGSYVGNGSATGPSINLGWEPQYVMIKNASNVASWYIFDSMRGMVVSGNDPYLLANSANAENVNNNYVSPTATGFDIVTPGGGANVLGDTYIYMAIRRGPMRTPTDGTKVFSPNAFNSATGTAISTGFPVDTQWIYGRPGGVPNALDRLRGVSTNSTGQSIYLTQTSTGAESTVAGNNSLFWNNTGFQVSSVWANYSDISWNFRRAPGFFDVVCYTGTGSLYTPKNHNLGVVPELIITKDRSSTSDWWTVASAGSNPTLKLNSTAATSGAWGSLGTTTAFNPTLDDSGTYVAYLFASCPGVSKVGSYTGTGATQTINCGFAGGARFVLIKRTDSTGGWYVWDTARGMVSGTDPSLLLNSTAAEVNANSIYTTTGGFQIVSTAAGINANGGSYIYLAIA